MLYHSNCEARKLLYVVILMFFVSLFSCQQKSKNLERDYPESFYWFEKNVPQKYINENGYQDFSIDRIGGVSRNSLGTSLRLFDRMSNYYIVINCDGSIAKINAPYDHVFLSDKNDIVIYFLEDKAYFPEGHTEKEFFTYKSGFDASKGYFLKKIKKNVLGVLNIDDPNTILDEQPYISGSIFSYGEKLFLFGQDRPEQIVAVVYNIHDGKLKLLEKQTIKLLDVPQARIGLVDFNPETLDLVIIDQFGKHSKSNWYSYNLREKVFKDLGNASDYGFFLSCDLVAAISGK